MPTCHKVCPIENALHLPQTYNFHLEISRPFLIAIECSSSWHASPPFAYHPCFFNSITLLTAALKPVLNLALHR